MEFDHTREEGIEAMNNLIANTTYTKNDFVMSDEMDVELGLELGTPLMKDVGDDFIVTAYDHWQGWQHMNDPNADDDYIDFCIEHGLI